MKNLENYVCIDGEDYYVEDHDPHIIHKDKAIEQLEGDLEYVGHWFVKDAKAYVFHALNPNRSKGHKDYVALKYIYSAGIESYDVVIMGYDHDDMLALSVQDGMLCNKCKTIVWSLYTHDYHGCRCKDNDERLMVDGGMSYMRGRFGKNHEGCFMVKINHLTRMITRENDD